MCFVKKFPNRDSIYCRTYYHGMQNMQVTNSLIIDNNSSHRNLLVKYAQSASGIFNVINRLLKVSRIYIILVIFDTETISRNQTSTMLYYGRWSRVLPSGHSNVYYRPPAGALNSNPDQHIWLSVLPCTWSLLIVIRQPRGTWKLLIPAFNGNRRPIRDSWRMECNKTVLLYGLYNPSLGCPRPFFQMNL